MKALFIIFSILVAIVSMISWQICTLNHKLSTIANVVIGSGIMIIEILFGFFIGLIL